MWRWRGLLRQAVDRPQIAVLVAHIGRIEPMTLSAVILGAVLLLVFASLANAVAHGTTHAFDEWLIIALRTPGDLADPLGPKWLEEMTRDFTALGSTGPGPHGARHRRLLGDDLQTPRRTARARLGGWRRVHQPDHEMGLRTRQAHLVPHGAEVFSASFPSGHSMMAAVVYLTLGALLARTQADRTVKTYVLTVAVLLTALIGVSRVYLGVHWPTDVLAGWVLGGVWALICLQVMGWLQARGQVEDESTGVVR